MTMMISAFLNGGIENTKPQKVITFETFIKTIRTDFYKSKIETIRSYEYKSKENTELKKNLDYVTIRGTFKNRESKKTAFLSVSKLIDIDIDIDKIDSKIFNKIIKDDFVYGFFRSPNNGYKIVFLIDIDNDFDSAYKQISDYYNAISIYLSQKYNFEFTAIDRCTDLARACFVSYDPEAYINITALCFGKQQLGIYKERIFKDVKISAKEVKEQSNQKDVFSFCEDILQRKGLYFAQGSKSNFRFQLALMLRCCGVQKSAVESFILSKYKSTNERDLLDIRSAFSSKYNYKENTIVFNSVPPIQQKIKQEKPKIEKVKYDSFPFEVLPQAYQDIINEVSVIRDFPKSVFATSILCAVSGVVGLSQSIVLDNGWKQYGSLFAVCVGGSAAGKSPTMDWALKPVIEIEKNYSKKYTQENNEYEAFKDLSKKEKDASGLNLTEPKRRHAITNDSTMESIFYAHQSSPRGFIFHSDELEGWFKKFNAYRKGADEKNWLSIFDNQYIKTMRISRSSDFIEKTFVTVFGGMTESSIEGLAKDGFDKDGFLFRFLFCFAEESKFAKWTDINKYLNPIYEQNYSNMINTLSDIEYLGQDIEFSLSTEANDVWAEWFDSNIELIKKYDSENRDDLVSISTKLSKYCCRFALILNAMKISCTGEITQIDEDTIKGAIKITEYFRKNTMRALLKIEEIREQSEVDQAKGNTNKSINWNDIFKENQILTTKELIDLLMLQGFSERTAQRYIRNELTKNSHGVWKM